MKKHPVLSVFLVVFGFVIAFLSIRHLTASKKQPGGWWNGGEYELIVQHKSVAGCTLEHIRVSNLSIGISGFQPGRPEIHVSGQAATEIATLLDQYDVWSWGQETNLSRQHQEYTTASLVYHGRTNTWSWLGYYQPPSQLMAQDYVTEIKQRINDLRYPKPHTAEMQRLQAEVMETIRQHPNDVR